MLVETTILFEPDLWPGLKLPRYHDATDCIGTWMFVKTARQLREPVRIGGFIIIDPRDDAIVNHFDCPVPRPGQPPFRLNDVLDYG
jgi:hypothetical protein